MKQTLAVIAVGALFGLSRPASALAIQQPAPAASATPTPAPTPVFSTPTDDFGPDLKAWMEAVKLSNKDAAGAAIARLQRKRAERGIENLSDVASAIRGRGEVFLSEGRSAEAKDAFALAAFFAPDSAESALGSARVTGTIAEGRGALAFARFRPWNEASVRATWLVALYSGLFLVSWGFGIGLLVRYAPVFAHDVTEGLPASLKPVSFFLAAIFLALPLAAVLGWGFLPFWWMALLFIFQSRAEKITTGSLLALLALSSLGLPYLAAPQQLLGASVSADGLEIEDGGINSAGLSAVTQKLASAPQDAELRLLKSTLLRRAGRVAESETTLQGLNDARAAHNLAALALLRGSAADALPGFEGTTATGSASEKAISNFNKSLALTSLLRFDEGKAARSTGDSLDAPLLARIDRIFTFDKDGSQVPAPPPIVAGLGPSLRDELSKIRVGPRDLISRFSLFAFGTTILVLLLMAWRGRQSFSKQCAKCGTTFCWLCQVRSTSVEVCTQCHHLFVVRKGISAQARNAKNAEIERYALFRQVTHRSLSLIAPGSSHIAAGHWALGLPLLLLWGGALGTFLTLRFAAPSLVAANPFGQTLAQAMLAALVIAVVAAQLLKPKVATVGPTRAKREREEKE